MIFISNNIIHNIQFFQYFFVICFFIGKNFIFPKKIGMNLRVFDLLIVFIQIICRWRRIVDSHTILFLYHFIIFVILLIIIGSKKFLQRITLNDRRLQFIIILLLFLLLR